MSDEFVDALGSRVYLDANIYIYIFEGSPQFQKPLRKLLKIIDDNRMQLIGSELLIPELLTKPHQDQNQALYDRYWKLLCNTKKLDLTPVTREVQLRSVYFRSQYQLKSMDALHLATAEVQECRSFLTNDLRLRRVAELSVLSLSELEVLS